MNIGSTNLTPNNYIENAQHVGLQRGAANITKNEDASLQTDDSVQLSLTEGPKAGAQTGMAQEKGKTETQGKTKEEGSVAGNNECKGELVPYKEPKGELVPFQATEKPSFESGGVGANMGGVPPFPNKPLTEEDLNKIQEFQKNMQQIQQKYLEMQQQQQKAWQTMMESQRKHMQDMWTMIQETNTYINQSVQTVIANRAKSQAAIMAKWTAVLTDKDR